MKISGSILLFIFFLSPFQTLAQTSQGAGNWNTDCTWDPAPCGGGSDVPNINNSGTIVQIGHAITLDINLTGGSQVKGDVNINASGSLTGAAKAVSISTDGSLNLLAGNASVGDLSVGSSGTLTIANACTLTVNGNVEFDNNSTVDIANGGVLIVTGNLINNNNSTGITINGTVTVSGNLDAGNGSAIGGITGSISVTGSITTTGTATVFGTTGDCASNCLTTSSNPLPVKLKSFDAYLDKETGYVFVIWSTLMEQNNDFFTVERSVDGQQFEVLETIKGAGNSSVLLHYEIEDMQPLKGQSYYRIKQTDFDGKFVYYPSVSVANHEIEKLKELKVWPNPSSDGNFSMLINGFHEEVDIVVHDLNGKEFLVHTLVDVKEGEIITSQDLSLSLLPGVYIIVAGNKKELVNKKLIVR